MKTLNVKKISATCNTCGSEENVVSVALSSYVSVVHCSICNNISGEILFASGSNCGAEMDIEFITDADMNSSILIEDIILINDNISHEEKELVKELAVEMVNLKEIFEYRLKYMEKAA